MRRKAIPLIAATLVGAMVPLGLSQPAGAEPPSLGSNSTTRPVDEHVITLITGDVLTVSSYADGHKAVAAEPPEGFAPATIRITTVDPESAEYRVELRANRSVESDCTDTSTISNWTFTSGHTDRPEVLPLPHVDYDLNADIHNQVSPLPVHLIELNPRYYGSTDPIPGARLRVEASYDEGATWREQRVLFGHNGRYMVLTYQPWSADTVSLRVHMTDRDGNSLEQTILRAYRVRR